jgi:thioredoxin-related protein
MLLKSTTFRNKKVADFYNQHFINVSIDMEKGEGPKLSEIWGIQAYPTMIIFDAKGNAILGTAGYMGASDLLKFGQQGLDK